MADRKITDLTALAAGSQATGDLLTIVDVSEGAATDKNKKITVESLFKGIPGNVGIGTSSPDQKLDVRTSSGEVYIKSNNGTVSNFFGVDSSNRGSIGTVSNHALLLNTNDQERMRIDSSGNVGIGNSSPSRKLHIHDGSGSSAQIVKIDSGGVGLLSIQSGTSSESRIEFGDSSNDDAGYIYYNNNGDVMEFGVNASERMRIDSSGNVGIGTSSPGNYNSGANNLVIAGSGSEGITIATGTSAGGSIYFADGTSGNAAYRGYLEYQHSSDYMRFGTAGLERMRIDSSGDLKFNSGFGSVGTAYGCRAWVNFNGTGTVAIRDSGNVSSITDNGTGNYTIAFTTAMPDANYCVVTTSSYATGVTEAMFTTVNGDALFTTGGFNAKSRDNGGTLRDVNYFFAAVFR